MGAGSRIAAWWTSPNVVLWCFRICLYASLLSMVLSITDMKILLTGYDLDQNHKNVTYPFIKIRTALMGWVALHHIAGAVMHFPALMDAIFNVIDIPVLIFFNYPIKVVIYDRKVLLVNVASAWILIIVLFFTLIGRLLIVRNAISKKEGAFRLYYISGQSIRSMQTFFAMFLGRSIAKTRIRGEGILIRSLRSLFALFLIFGMCFYALQNLLLAPITESIVGPIKELRAQTLPWDTGSDIMNLGWNIILMRELVNHENRTLLADEQSFNNGALDLTQNTPNYNDTQTFHDAVTITPLWDRRFAEKPACIHQPGEAQVEPYMKGRSFGDAVQYISIRCPSRLGDNTTRVIDGVPDLLISINYTALGIPSATLSNQWTNVVQVFVGLVENDASVLRHTRPFSVPSNVNQLVEVDWMFRETSNSKSTATLGVFDSSDIFAIANILQILPDPLASDSPSSPIQKVDHTSTVRVFTTLGPGDLKIIQDSREKSVLAGFSAVGGLWSFLDGIYAFFFGLTVFAIVFESKPLSIFGLVHGWRKRAMAQKYFKTYPELQKDVNEPRQGGLIAYLQDNFIDLDPFMDDDKDDNTATKKAVATDMTNLSKGGRGSTPESAEEGSSFINIGGMPGHSTSKLVYPDRREENIPMTVAGSRFL